MRPVDQTILGYPSGNCLMACVASILEVPLESLPDLGDDHTGAWWEPFRDALRRNGYEPIYWIEDAAQMRPAGYHIVGGQSPRGEFLHSVVAHDGAIVHDPHPSRAGITSIHHWYLLIPRVAAGAA